MKNFNFINNGIKEAFYSAKIAKQNVGSGNLFCFFLEICWSFVWYGARPRDYVMFEFYYQNHKKKKTMPYNF